MASAQQEATREHKEISEWQSWGTGRGWSLGNLVKCHYHSNWPRANSNTFKKKKKGVTLQVSQVLAG